MATWTENLVTRRNAIAAELAAGQTTNGQSFRQPSINVDGENIDTDKYVDRLYRELAAINEQLTEAGVSTDGTTNTAFEQITIGST